MSLFFAVRLTSVPVWCLKQKSHLERIFWLWVDKIRCVHWITATAASTWHQKETQNEMLIIFPIFSPIAPLQSSFNVGILYLFVMFCHWHSSVRDRQCEIRTSPSTNSNNVYCPYTFLSNRFPLRFNFSSNIFLIALTCCSVHSLPQFTCHNCFESNGGMLRVFLIPMHHALFVIVDVDSPMWYVMPLIPERQLRV